MGAFLDGEAERAASLLAQRLLLAGVLPAVLPAFVHGLLVLHALLDPHLAFLAVTQAMAVGFGRGW